MSDFFAALNFFPGIPLVNVLLVTGGNANFTILGKGAIIELLLYVKKSHNIFGNNTFEGDVRAFPDEK